MDRFAKIIVVMIVMFVLLLGGLYFFIKRSADVLRQAAVQSIAKEEKVLDLGAVVTQVRGLSRLETASMRVMQVMRIDQSYGSIPNKIAGDSISFLAVGEVIAGVDLSQVTRDDVRLEGDGVVVIALPPAQILVSRLDNEASHVVARDTGLLRRQDPGLETRARQHAEKGIVAEAQRKGIINLANANAEAKLAQFLHTLRIDKVRFERKTRTGG